MLKFLVTGAAGQLGKDVVRELENRGSEVTQQKEKNSRSLCEDGYHRQKRSRGSNEKA